MEDTAEARAFLANLRIEVVPVKASALPVLLCYDDLSLDEYDRFIFQNVAYQELEISVAHITPDYKSISHELAFEHKQGEYVLIDNNHALKMMIFHCMKREPTNQIIKGKLVWARKEYFRGEIPLIRCATSRSNRDPPTDVHRASRPPSSSCDAKRILRRISQRKGACSGFTEDTAVHAHFRHFRAHCRLRSSAESNTGESECRVIAALFPR